MLPLTKQCVSKELAEKMKTLGFKQESYFVWHSQTQEEGFVLSRNLATTVQPKTVRRYSAYTVAELGEMLPKLDGSGYVQGYKDIQGRWIYDFQVSTNHYLYKGEAEENEADARALMLIYLAEHSLINPTELK